MTNETKQASPIAYAYFAMGFYKGCDKLRDKGYDVGEFTDEHSGELNVVHYLMEQVPTLEQHYLDRTDCGADSYAVFPYDIAEELGCWFIMESVKRGRAWGMVTSGDLLGELDNLIDANTPARPLLTKPNDWGEFTGKRAMQAKIVNYKDGECTDYMCVDWDDPNANLWSIEGLYKDSDGEKRWYVQGDITDRDLAVTMAAMIGTR